MVVAVSATPNPNSKVPSRGQSPKRPPLLPSEANNGVVGPRRPKSRDVTSRYLSSSKSSCSTNSSASSYSSSSSSSSSSRRCPSPIVSRTVPVTPMPPPSAAIKRSQSVERRRPATPRPNTPGNSAEMSSAARLLVTSTRSLSVSFPGESCSVPISKTKPAPMPASPANKVSGSGKGTPERRKATPGRDQTENSRPIDQHRWPARSRELNSLTKSVDYTAEKKKLGGSASVVRALQQSMIDESSKASITGRLKVQSTKTDPAKEVQLVTDTNSAPVSATTSDLVASDAESVSSGSTGGGPRGIIGPARFWQETSNRLRRLPEPVSPVSRNKTFSKLVASPKPNSLKKSFTDSPISSPRGVSSTRGLSSPLRGGVRPASPSKSLISSASSPSRGMQSPSRTRNGVASKLNNDLITTPSILSFAAEARRGKVGENRILDAHILRLLYNRHMQWRFVNARAEAAMASQKVTAEKGLYDAWVTTSKFRHSVRNKRLELQLLQQNLKLHSILKGQMSYLDDWDFIDQDHSSSLSGAVEALEASTIRLPVVGVARGDVQNVKDAISSAVDVMQAMASAICSLLTKVDQVNPLVAELANITAEERVLIHQCKDLLSTLTAMQVKDCSLRTHVLQLRHACTLKSDNTMKS
ncbi:hypothetical protein NMG60_11031233 [Bertholletia excelsa]